MWKFSGFKENTPGVFYTEGSLHSCSLCLLSRCTHVTFCASIQRESIPLPPTLIHTTENLWLPMRHSQLCPTWKPVEEDHLGISVLNFPVPSLLKGSKEIHGQYGHQIVNTVGTDNRETSRARSASQTCTPGSWMLPTETSRKLSDLAQETRGFQSSKPWRDPMTSCQHVPAGVELCLHRDEPWATSLTSAHSTSHQPGQTTWVTWGVQNGLKCLHWGHWTAQEMSQSLNCLPQGYSLCTIRGAGYPGWSVGMDRLLWRRMRAGSHLHCS